MPVGVSFGAVGDIITLSIVIKDLVKALDDSRGSSAEYREIIRELWALDRVLLEVELLWRTCESTIELNALRETARRMTDQCRCSIEAFLAKVKKYGLSLSDRGSERVIRDIAMKLRWQVAHSDELTNFRAEINAHCSAISMLLVTASVNLTKLNDKRLHARLSDNDARIKASSDAQQLLLQEVNDKLDENNNQIRAVRTVTAKISETLRLGWIRQLGEELKDWMRKIYFVHIATYNAVVDISGRLPGHLERVLYQEPFILEDGIGRIAPVHMQFICSWEAFDSVLELRFRNMQGYTMVQNKEYVIQESSTRREIDRSLPWEASFLPGQNVVMSMLFNDTTSSTTSCPRCQCSSEKPQNCDTQCAGCGMWYRRITEYDYIDPPPPANQIPTRKLRETPAVFGSSPFKAIVFGPPPSNDPEDLMGTKKRKSENTHDNDIARFKRVRVLSKKTRVRTSRPGPKPFIRFATETKGFNGAAMGHVHQQTKRRPGQTVPQALQVKTLAQVPSLPPLPPAFQTGIFRPTVQYFGDATESNSNDDNNTVGGNLNTYRIIDEADMRHGNRNADTHKASSFDQDIEYGSTNGNRLPSSLKSNSRMDYNKEYFLGQRYITDEFHQAVCSGNLRRLRRLLEDINIELYSPIVSLLYQAIISHNAPATSFLLKYRQGLNVKYRQGLNGRHSSGWTVLMRAAENGDAKLVSTLLHCGACPNMPLPSGQTALHIAAAEGHEEVVGILLENQDSASNVTDDLTAANEAALVLAVTNGHVGVTRMLLEHGADYSTRDTHGRTLLHRAAWNGCGAVARFLLSRGLGVDVRDNYGQSALHKAAACGEEFMVRLLARSGADLDARDEEGCTPLDRATANGFEAVADGLTGFASERLGSSDILRRFHLDVLNYTSSPL